VYVLVGSVKLVHSIQGGEGENPGDSHSKEIPTGCLRTIMEIWYLISSPLIIFLLFYSVSVWKIICMLQTFIFTTLDCGEATWQTAVATRRGHYENSPQSDLNSVTIKSVLSLLWQRHRILSRKPHYNYNRGVKLVPVPIARYMNAFVTFPRYVFFTKWCKK